MTDEIGIFVSYAHDDDLQLSASKDKKGFVTFFCEMLRAKLRDLGATRARIWLDRQRISDGDQFEGMIDDGLRKAHLLVVVMSNNWLESTLLPKGARRVRRAQAGGRDRKCRRSAWSWSERATSTGRSVRRCCKPRKDFCFTRATTRTTSPTSSPSSTAETRATTASTIGGTSGRVPATARRSHREGAGSAPRGGRPADRPAERQNHLSRQARGRHGGGL